MAETRTQKTKKNAISSVGQNLINLMISLVGRVIFVHVLNASYLGINGLFTNILGILSLADLGMNTVMMYHLYEPIAKNNTKHIKALVDFFKKMYTVIAIIIFSMGIVLIPFLKYIINLPTDMPEIYLYYIIALLNVVISYLFIYRTTLISADQKTYILNNCIIIFKILIFVFQVVVLFLFQSYLLYLLVSLVLNFVCNLLQNRIAIKMYPYLNEKKNSIILTKEQKAEVFTNIKATFLYKICGTIQSNTDSILTSIFCGTILVGVYSNYILIINQIVSIIGIFFNAAKASVGNLLVTGSEDGSSQWELFEIFELLNYWIVTFSTVCYFVLVNPFVEIVFGEEYILSLDIVIAIILNFYTSNIRQNIWMFRETSGMFKQMKYITAVTAIINLGLSIVLGNLWGMFGIIIATVISRMLYAWWKEPQILFKHYFRKSPIQYYKNYCGRISLCVVICAIVYWMTSFSLINNLLISFLIKVIICVLVSNIFLWIIYYRSFQFNYLVEHIFSARIRKYLYRNKK